MANTFISRSASSTGNRRTWTFSAWVKLCRVSNEDATQMLFGTYTDGNNRLEIGINASNKFVFKEKASSSTNIDFTSTQRFRDPHSFYHFVVKVDTTQATESNRVKIYVNGEQITDWVDDTYPSQNYDTFMNLSGRTYTIGQEGNNNYYWDGLMTHVHLTDGYAYDASTFGSTDSTSGIWKPNTAPSVTYGTNGFFLKFENSGNLDLDSSGNNLTFATSGTLTQNVDTPSNNFCTISPLDNMNASNTTIPGKLENGNLSFINNDSNQIYTRGSIGVKSGKYYWEAKQGSGTAWAIGIMVEAMLTQTNNQFWDTTTVTGVAANGSSNTLYINGGSGDSWNTGITVSASSIYGFALDVDNRALYIHHNGTYLTANSAVGDPTSGSSRTGSVLGELTTRGGTGGLNYIPENEYIYPFQGDLSTSNSTNLQMNFGSGYFATTAISSEGSNASGLGKFEYNVPAGYTALCTKGLNE